MFFLIFLVFKDSLSPDQVFVIEGFDSTIFDKNISDRYFTISYEDFDFFFFSFYINDCSEKMMVVMHGWW